MQVTFDTSRIEYYLEASKPRELNMILLGYAFGTFMLDTNDFARNILLNRLPDGSMANHAPAGREHWIQFPVTYPSFAESVAELQGRDHDTSRLMVADLDEGTLTVVNAAGEILEGAVTIRGLFTDDEVKRVELLQANKREKHYRLEGEQAKWKVPLYALTIDDSDWRVLYCTSDMARVEYIGAENSDVTSFIDLTTGVRKYPRRTVTWS